MSEKTFEFEGKTVRFCPPPIHTHADEYGYQVLCDRVICPHGMIGIEVLPTTINEDNLK
jgi:hypothetical protein